MLNKNNPQEETETLVEESVNPGYSLLLYNDDVNTFDHVIESLVEICNHHLLQAEQCAVLVHYSGKCAVKNGSYETLEPMCTALLERGLSAKIEN